MHDLIKIHPVVVEMKYKVGYSCMLFMCFL